VPFKIDTQASIITSFCPELNVEYGKFLTTRVSNKLISIDLIIIILLNKLIIS
jgi:hypothetical protein